MLVPHGLGWLQHGQIWLPHDQERIWPLWIADLAPLCRIWPQFGYPMPWGYKIWVSSHLGLYVVTLRSVASKILATLVVRSR